ncbi:MAG: RNA pyrophosphohydrolase [Holosporaceae bacterium]|jgi:putative (di)nucleoside polyphosphate hydrolase|nr:RNA pyrophosphohydrolase [Holosporaceae bacterium]
MIPYRKCVGIFLIKDSNIFVGQRIDVKRAWQLPQGGVEEGETCVEAAQRELFEETNISSVKLLGSSDSYKYKFPPSIKAILTKKRGQLMYIGQEITFIAFKFIGEESEINLEKTPQEFVNWKWMSPDELLKSIVYFKKPSYKMALRKFRSLKII